MCGIAGIGNKEDELDVSAAVEDSLERMRHRGPDDKGVELLSWHVPVIDHRHRKRTSAHMERR